ncbi:bifunctional diguanylate cyclase/phosphodiesterase [Aquibium oceanicum]|uniref:Bifunctional diguanylate cyclase/phosphodiesterase n=1 Tax=Aquibium oceanicum TaxID=1670800 RepID=A0A1L3SYI3_9HYPH|nr:bifunctional diguanylate cyclase/phosphodiesterase [Aquibium oceanicum]
MIRRPANATAATAFVVIIAAGIVAEYQNQQVFERELRAKVYNEASLVRARLEGNINGNVQLVRGLVATISANPDIGQQEFSLLAAKLMAERTQLRNIAAAPDLVVSMMYPIEGNEQAIGLDYTTSEAQRQAAFRARDTGELVLAGPLDLVQGGKGLVARFPVFVDEPNHGHFWGIVSAVIDVPRLYADSGLYASGLGIDIAITGTDALGADGTRFFGREDVAQDDPVELDVQLPSGGWRMAAIPKGGWKSSPPNVWWLRAVMFIGGAFILVPIFASGRLMEERQLHIGELHRREMQLARLSRRLRLALDTSRVGVWELDIESNELFWDDRMNEIYGYPADAGSRDYASWSQRLHPEDAGRAQEEFRTALEGSGKYLSEYRLALPNGDVHHIRAIGAVYRDFGEPARIVGVNWDVSADVALNEELKRANTLTEARNRELEAAKERIEFTALHDALTGLPNRRYLDGVLAEHAELFEAGRETAGLLHIDLDRFKQINDTLGHAAGDAMLVHAARVLRNSVRDGDFVARVGGDEFVIVCRRAWSHEEAGTPYLSDLAERIIGEIQRPVSYQSHECRFGVSIGIASDTDVDANPTQLLVHADIALYRAKSRGRNRYQFFNDALRTEIVTTKRIADDILSGIEQGQFVAHYQPQFDAESQEVIGVEALARWEHPIEGLLQPASFMKIAEELNVVDVIDRIILEQTLTNLKEWDATGLAIPKASVNVSARRLHDEELVTSLRELSIEPGRISFELVESIFLDEQDELVAWNVDLIKELGIDIEIDDFGTGYASIVSLMKLKPSRLKIDRQLVMPISQSRAQCQLVGSIIEIGKSLGIQVLAEGVETMEHARILNKLGCDALQGYAFARPLPSRELVEFVESCRWRRAS